MNPKTIKTLSIVVVLILFGVLLFSVLQNNNPSDTVPPTVSTDITELAPPLKRWTPIQV